MYRFLLLIIALLNVSFVYAQEPKNLESLKERYIKYNTSGEYLKDQAKVIDQAMDYLKWRLANSKSSSEKKWAIVLDIDETSLSNYPDMLAMGLGGSLAQIIEAENKGTDPVIPPTLKLYRYAKENNIAVFFVTGRTESSRDATTKNLEAVGYKNWDGLILKPENYHEKSASIYKIKTRADITKQGFDIVLNIGDQKSDLIGGYADKTFKLPNPYYLIP